MSEKILISELETLAEKVGAKKIIQNRLKDERLSGMKAIVKFKYDYYSGENYLLAFSTLEEANKFFETKEIKPFVVAPNAYHKQMVRIDFGYNRGSFEMWAEEFDFDLYRQRENFKNQHIYLFTNPTKTRDELVDFLSSTNKKIVYTKGIEYQNSLPSVHRIPLSLKEAINMVKDKFLLFDITEEYDVIHIKSFSECVLD